ncbi:MAG: AAA family ATPase [Hellea sp.]|nr:AAA family ATPase [Hellea sp.]
MTNPSQLPPIPQQVPAPQPTQVPFPQAPMAQAAPMPSPYGQPQPAQAAPTPTVPAPPMGAAPNAAPGGFPPPPQGQTQMQPPMPSSATPSAATPNYPMPSPEPFGDGGEVALPNIAIQAFCERSETAGSIHEMSRDWRMKRTNLKIFMGGLPAAVDYYHKESTPALILIESGMRGPELFAQLEQLASVCDEGTQVIMIGAANDIKLYRQLLEKGVSDYIVPPFHPLSMIRTISERFTDPEKPFTGRVAAFFGAKGGVGSSTIAHNIAWCLAEVIGQETSLVDLDSSWGTTGLDFAYDATQGLEEALAQPDRLDDTLLDRIMLRHTAKLSILPASGTLDNSPVMKSEAFETVVNSIRKISPLTLLDMPHYWCDWTRTVLTSADDVIITANCDLANLRNTKNLIDHLKAERPNDALPILILNQVGRSKNHEISVKDFGAAVGMDPALVVPFDPDSFFEAANDGKMLTDVKSAATIVNGMNYIATRLKTGQFAAPVENTGKRSGKGKGKAGKGASPKDKGGKSSLFSKLKKRK